ncbi:MAG: serine/threonine-protein kinase [Deltaproteobacteria bacterium]|nr:serine/threonine-protein kinase [Myxococcales bacterium]MDP3220503.1 serine/threonine-protein kinase [Deltaproteobacteria bacterium]
MTAVGDILGGKYQLLRLLGEGGMGQVFEALNQNTDRRVAIKTLHPQWVTDPSVVQRFLREARAATKISHPNVVDVLDLDVDRDTGLPYIVQEFLAGESLEAHLDARADKRLPVDEALRILVPVMQALVAAHRLGIVHRDLKPANLLLTVDRAGAPIPKVIDFGIAKLMETQSDSLRQTATGTLVGTPSYMSPEQATGADGLDERTDVWSLGVVFYELLTGALPYDAPNYNLLVAKIVYEEPALHLLGDPSIPRDVATVVTRALQKNRDARFPSMQALLDATAACDISATITQPRISATPARAPTPAPPARAAAPAPTLAGWSVHPDAPPRRTATIAALSVLAAVLVFTAGFLMFRPTPVVTVLATPTPTPRVVAPPTPATAPVVAAPVTPVVAAPAPAPTPAPAVAVPAPTLAPTPAPAPVVAAPAPVRRAPTAPTRPRRPPSRTTTTTTDFDRGYE